MPYEALYALVPTDGGPRLGGTLIVRLPGAAGAHGRLVGRLVRRTYARKLDRMRELLEP